LSTVIRSIWMSSVPAVPAGYPEGWTLGDALQAVEASGEPDDDVAGGAPVQATTEAKREPLAKSAPGDQRANKARDLGEERRAIPTEAFC
jgi:hypothetical protein